MLKKVFVLSILCLIFSCKRVSYLPEDGDAFLASLKFSDGLALQEAFDKNTFAYSLKVPSSLTGFFVICVVNHPSSKYAVYVQDLELPFPYIKILPALSNFTIRILVTSPNGNTQTYTVDICVV